MGFRTLARALNARLALRRQVDDLLDDFDILLTPTITGGFVELPSRGTDSRDESSTAPVANPALVMHNLRSAMASTCGWNLTGHPALTVPVGSDSDGLPFSVQLAGRWYAEDLLYRAARAIEAAD